MSFDIYLSPPNVGELESKYVLDALESGWVAPLGPDVEAFEHEVADFVGVKHAVALASGTAGLHLCLLAAGVGPGDEVIVPTMTFAATAFAVKYVGARPIFIDSESQSWNVDPDVLQDFLKNSAVLGDIPKAIIVVDIFGQTANYQAITAICDLYGVTIIEDAAEALGAKHGMQMAGSFGAAGVFSFNGNKIITTSGGGMVVSNEKSFTDRIRHLATQARESVHWYEHNEVGYNYRLSNILAALGRAQLSRLPQIIESRKVAREHYAKYFSNGSTVKISQNPSWGTGNNWVTLATFETAEDSERTRLILDKNRIESRAVWKPMHLQPVFAGEQYVGGNIAVDFFERGLCLPASNVEAAQSVTNAIELSR